MADERIRRQIALLAARLMYDRSESEYFTAKRKAARRLGVEYRFRPKDLPSNAEIRDQIQSLANFYEGDRRQDNLKQMRLEAYRMMCLLSAFRPRLIGSVWTGHIRQGSDIDIHVFSNTTSAVTAVLDEARLPYEVERKRVIKHNEERVFTHIHAHGQFDIELTLYDLDKVNYPFKSSITGRLIEQATLPELEAFLRQEYAGIDLSAELDAPTEKLEEAGYGVERFDVYRRLLLLLERVQQNATYHPEGDALYHSLQVFELMRQREPYDEELLLAVLLHDVGKAIDSADHVSAALDALEDHITARTRFLIEHHMDAHQVLDGTIGHRARERLRSSEHFESLMLLQECDAAGRSRGARVCDVDAALDYIRQLADESEEW